MNGKVALVTGAARGMGRTHATKLAEEGADIIALDICNDVGSVKYGLGTDGDLSKTAEIVSNLGRRIFARKCDVRSFGELESVVSDGVAELGGLDIVCANAGVFSAGLTWELESEAWKDLLDINLTGVWHTVKATVPRMIENGSGGSIILTSSVCGTRGFAGCAHYTAAKHGVVGLMRSLVNELSTHRIRVNTVNPTQVDTAMLQNSTLYEMFMPELAPEERTKDKMREVCTSLQALPVPWVEPIDVTNAVLFLASDEARYITGQQLKIDLGFSEKV